MVTHNKVKSSQSSSAPARTGIKASKPSSSSRRDEVEEANRSGQSVKKSSKKASEVVEIGSDGDDEGKGDAGEEDVDDDDDDDDSEADGYEVEKIVDHKKQKGVWFYLVKWLGYPDEENTWEPEEHMENPETVANYWKSLPSNRQPGRKAQHQAAKRGRTSESRTPSPTSLTNSNTAKLNGKRNNVGSSENKRSSEPVKGGHSASSSRPRHQQSAHQRSTSGTKIQREELMEEDESMEEDQLDEDVDDATWAIMEKGWMEKYDQMDSWEDEVVQIATVEKEPDGNIRAFIDFPGNVRLIYPLAVANRKCPQHLLAFYEAHLLFKSPKRTQTDVGSSGLSGRI